MKKTLVAIAAIAAATGAMAQSSVTLYGAIDAGYSDNSKTVAGVKEGQQAVSFSNMSSTRFGMKGTEDLGQGMKANFVIESGISSNAGSAFSAGATTAHTKAGTTVDATSLGNRELNASLQFGNTTIGAGYGGTAVRSIVLGYDAMGGTNFIGNTLTTDAQFSSNRATGLGISQAISKEFTVGAAISRNVDTADGKADVKTATGYTLNASFANGPLSIAAATQKTNTAVNAVTAVPFVFDTTTGGVTAAGKAAVAQSDLDKTTNIIGAKYALSAATLFATYGTVKTEDNGVANTIVKGEGKRTSYNYGLQVPMGKVTLAALISGGNVEQAAATTAGEKQDYTGYGVGARYAFSKRTLAYVNMGSSTLKAGATASSYKEVKNTQTAIGLLHSF
jgi:predicted porin